MIGLLDARSFRRYSDLLGLRSRFRTKVDPFPPRSSHQQRGFKGRIPYSIVCGGNTFAVPGCQRVHYERYDGFPGLDRAVASAYAVVLFVCMDTLYCSCIIYGLGLKTSKANRCIVGTVCNSMTLNPLTFEEQQTEARARARVVESSSHCISL